MPKDAESSLKVTRLIFAAMIFGVVSFAVVIMIVGEGIHGGESPQLGQPLAIIAGALTVLIALPAGIIARKVKFGDSEAVADQPPERRLQSYLAAKILTAALIEAPALLWLVGALLDPSPVFTIGAGVCILLLLFRFPTRHELENLTQLNQR